MGILYNYLNSKLQVGLSEMILMQSNTCTSILIKRSVILFSPVKIFIVNKSPYFSINAFWFVTCIWENFQLGMIRETHSQIKSDRDTCNAAIILILAIIINYKDVYTSLRMKIWNRKYKLRTSLFKSWINRWGRILIRYIRFTDK